MHDPYDPRINDEYEALVRKWTDHLLSKSRHSPIDSAISSTTTSTTTPPSPHHLTKNNKIIDRLLEEQWIDAQRVLSCAQAWNTRDSLSIEEAVRTMNILGLRMMQRSLTTRHELNAQHQQPCPAKTDEPNLDMPSFDLQSKTLLDEAITIPRFSLALSLDEDDEHEMHAPLLRRYQQSSDDSSSDSTSNHHHPITSNNNNVQAANPCSTTTSTLSTPARRPFRLMQSPSAPDFSESALLMERENCANKFAPASNYYRYYPMSWRPLPEHGDGDVNDDPEDNNRHISISSSSTSSSSTSSSDQDHEGYTWKSWFNHTHHQADNQHKQHICTFCWNPIAKKSLSTGDADDAVAARLLSSSHSSSLESTTMGVGASGQAQQVWSPESYHSACSPDKALLDDKYGCSNDESSSMEEEDVFETPTTSSFGFQTDTILRSESSISAFRPISKNLAPRCSPPSSSSSSSPTDNWRYRRREISSSMQAADLPQQQRRPAIPKSQSFPSKVASLASSSSNNKVPDVPIIKSSTTKSSASATTVPATIMGKSADKATSSTSSSSKERNFVMRSIVSKKASLSKLFSGSKK